ncbi:MAG: acetyltransferase [Bacillota bacterium]|nr:MAG: acetyltransferase [Bacillota bacterium]
MHDIRKITPHEVDDAIKLSEYSFKYKLVGEKRQQRVNFMSDHIVFGAFDGAQMIAKTHVIPLGVIINDQEYAIGGIASVSTYPEHRRKGIVNRLLDMALLTMRVEGYIMSYLGPFDIGFYRRYGYELISNLKKTTVLATDLFYYKDVCGTVVRKHALETLDVVNQVYAQWCRQYNGMLVRTEKWWSDSVNGEHSVAVYYNEAGLARGYVFYYFKEEVMKVGEYAYLDEASRRGLWNFISNHDSMIEKVEIMSADHESMSFLFNNPDAKIEIIPDFMGRVVLVKEFLDRYITGDVGAGFNLVLTVHDARAQWNTGVYQVSATGVEFEASGKAEGLEMDINTFTALFLGCQKPEFLYESGRITGDRDQLAMLKQVLTTKQCAFIDRF